MYYENYGYWGMHFFWWIIWMVLLFWIFATPYSIPGQRSRKETPLDVLKKRFAAGQITEQEFQDKKKIIEG